MHGGRGVGNVNRVRGAVVTLRSGTTNPSLMFRQLSGLSWPILLITFNVSFVEIISSYDSVYLIYGSSKQS